MTFGERYLARPELFPGRLSGEPLGDETVAIEIAGLAFALEGLDAPRAEAVRRRFSGWLIQPAPDEATVTTAFRACEGDFRPFGSDGDEMTTDVAREASVLKLCGPYWMGLLDPAPRARGALFLPPDGAPFGESAIENYLRVLSAYALRHAGGAIVHSAAILDGERAYLFPASSGSGKSTLSRVSLAEGRAVLSDDMNALVRHGGRTCVAQLPFTGESSRERVPGGPFPLAGVYRLRKGTATTTSALGRSEALGLCFAQSPWLNQDPAASEELWETLGALLDGVALGTLTFGLTEPVWPRLSAAGAGRAVA